MPLMRQSVFHHLIFATVIFTVLLISGVLLASHIAVMQGITDAERATAPEVAQKVIQILNMERKSLSIFTHDWGVWDDTYRFVQDGNEQYIQSNLQEGTFSSAQLNIAVYMNATGGIIYQRGYDYRNQTDLPIPDDVYSSLLRYHLLENQDQHDPKTGIIPLRSGPVLISVQGIYRSDGSGPQAGFLIFGRYLDADRIREISEISVFPFQITGPYSDREEYAGDNPLPYAYLDPSLQSFIIYSVISDISDNPAYLVRTEIPFRTPYTSSLIISLLITTSLICGLFLSALILYYRRYFLRYLEGITRILDTKQSSDHCDTVLSRAPAELNPLAQVVDKTVSTLRRHQDELARTQEELAEAEERIRILFEHAQDAICVIDDTIIVDCNQVFSGIFHKDRVAIIGQDIHRLAAELDARYSASFHGFIQQIISHHAGSVTRFEWSFPDVREDDSIEVVFDIIVRDITFHEKSLLFIIARDITRQVEFQHNQERLLERLEQNLVHMGALNDQIRNPLTIISTLIDEGECPEKDRIMHEIERIDRLIDKIDDGFIASEKVWQFLHKKRDNLQDIDS